MKRKYLIVSIAVAGSLVGGWLLWHPPKMADSALPPEAAHESATLSTNIVHRTTDVKTTTAKTARANITPHPHTPTPDQITAVTRTPTSEHDMLTLLQTLGFHGERTEDLRKPIRFYGRVVDEQKNPVLGVGVSFEWTEPVPGLSAHASAVTDKEGNFAADVVTGRILRVALEKEGYYISSGEAHYTVRFPLDAESKPDRPDPNYPVMFHLRKKGQGVDLITSQYGVNPELGFSMSGDGLPARVDFFNRKTGNQGQMELSAQKPQRDLNDRSAKEWSFRLSIPDGGFVEQNDEFPFEAPPTGYQSTVEFNFKPGQTNWTDILHGRYYIAFGQPRKYGWIEIETGIYRGVRLKYAINPDGSRNLEPK